MDTYSELVKDWERVSPELTGYSPLKTSTSFMPLLLVALFAFSTTAHTQTKFVTTHGREFITPDGRPILLKGINLGNWLVPEGYMFKFKSANSPRLIQSVLNQLIGEDDARNFWRRYRDQYITLEDIRFIKQSGFNSIRVPFNYRLFVTDTDPPRLEGPGYELLDRVVKWSTAEGLYVILDMHAAPGGQTGDNIDDSWGYPFLFESTQDQELTVRIWQELARRYKDEPNVLGYDLLNEPIPQFFDTPKLFPKLEPLYRKIVAGIRQVDRSHIIFLGGAQWDTNFKVFGPPFDSQLAYTFHKYWMDVKQEELQEYVDFSTHYNVPVWLGETGENKDDWIESFRKLLEKNNIGWCFWPYKKLDAASCIVSIDPPADWNLIVSFADAPRTTFADIRKARPVREKIEKALSDYLEQVKFKNCHVNKGYLRALGLN